MTVGEQIRETRKRNGLTQIELANASGVSVNSIRLYESNKTHPTIAMVKKIAIALGVSTVELLDDNVKTLIHAIEIEDQIDEESKQEIMEQFQKSYLDSRRSEDLSIPFISVDKEIADHIKDTVCNLEDGFLEEFVNTIFSTLSEYNKYLAAKYIYSLYNLEGNISIVDGLSQEIDMLRRKIKSMEKET